MWTGDLTALHVVSTPQRRGAEQVAWGLAQRLDELGVASDVVAWSGSTGSASLPVEVLSSSRFDPRGLARLVALARRHDVIVAHGGTTLWPSVIAGGVSRRPLVYRNIGDPAYWVSSGLRRLRVRAALQRAAAVVALYPEAAAWMAREHHLPPDRFHVIPNAVSADDFPDADVLTRRRARRRLGLAEGGRVVAYVGALSREKRPDLALEVARRLPDVELLLAGDGPLRSDLVIDAAGLGERVRLLGAVAETAEVYAAADVLVIPSDTEGLPGVLLEALCTGTPVVATAVGAIPDVLNPARGRVVPVGNVAALVGAVDEVAGSGRRVDAAERDRLVRDHSLDVVVHRWVEVLRALA